jgi:CRISPR-associated protein (TIGR03986 family)
VFGWVSQNPDAGSEAPKVAYRGHVRVGPVACTNPDGAIKEFSQPKILAILGEPKPQQGRFYLGKSDGLDKSDGTAQPPGRSKEVAGYHSENRIRGPKVYPHHRQFGEPDSKGNESNQNRSITGWVNPEVKFEFDLHFENLSRIELGALVWLLKMPEDHFLRLGLGKPLGFGSVRAEIISEGTRVSDGHTRTHWLASGAAPDPKSTDLEAMNDLEAMRIEFKNAIENVNSKLLDSFLKSAFGFDSQHIRYPTFSDRNSQNGPPDTNEHFLWFVKNDAGCKWTLPDLLDDPSLWLDPRYPCR